MTADRMTEEEARDRLVGHVAARNEQLSANEDACFAVAAILATHDALAVLLDPAELGKRWTPEQLRECLWAAKRAGTVTTDVPPGAQSYTSQEMQRRWRIVPDEEGARDG